MSENIEAGADVFERYHQSSCYPTAMREEALAAAAAIYDAIRGESSNEDDERATFEAWMKLGPPTTDRLFERFVDGEYVMSIMQWTWIGWKARADHERGAGAAGV